MGIRQDIIPEVVAMSIKFLTPLLRSNHVLLFQPSTVRFSLKIMSNEVAAL